MRKLKKMNLREHSILSKKEMKNVVGGYSYTSCSSSCSVGTSCTTPSGQGGTCRNEVKWGWKGDTLKDAEKYQYTVCSCLIFY